jgi:hypothetical protein
MENQQNASASAQDATSYSQDSASNKTQNSQSQNDQKGGVLSGISSTIGNIQLPDAVKNIQLPQAVKDFGATCARSYSGMSTTQKVVGGAALLGASYWVANNQGWIGQAKSAAKKSKSTNANHSNSTQHS